MTRWFALWWLASVSVLALEPPPPYFEDAQQDGQGVVWAYSRAEYNHIYSFDGTQWMVRSTPPEMKGNAMPATVVKMSDGAMACVWRVDDHLLAVTRHAGDDARLLGTCAGEIAASGMTVRPLADSQNRLWITGEFPKIYRADGKGGVTMVHEITPQEFRNPNPKPQGYNQIHAVEDGHGRIWVWSNPAASNYASLRGVLIFTGDKAEMHETFGTIKGPDILAVARADDKHMWVTVGNDGIYKVDIDTFGIERVPDPAPKALCCIHELFVHDGDTYAVESLPVFKDTLWRLHDGKWKQIIPEFDLHPFSFIPRSILPLKDGMLVESYGRGPWYIPKDGPPALLSWHNGFPIEGAHALARFADGTFFSIGHNDEIFHDKLTLPPTDRTNSRLIEIEPVQEWTVSPSGHIWMIPHQQPIVLKEWDGFKWITHELPPAPKPRFGAGLHEDDQGRLWLWGQTVDIFDPHSQQWQSFPDISAAFVAFMDRPVQFIHDEWLMTPQYSADHKRIAYRRGVTEINYFNGTTWQKWERPQITGEKPGDGAVGAPWFNEGGKLCVTIRNKTSWQLDDAGKWSSIPYVVHFPTDIWAGGRNQPPRPVPPEGSVTNHPESISIDNLGTTWFTWQGNLYKAVPGYCVKVFGPDEINPFRSNRRLGEVFVDAQGNTFLTTAAEGTNPSPSAKL